MSLPILVCGTITIDSILRHEKNIAPHFQNITNDVGLNFVANTYSRYFGGTAANVAYNLSLFNVGCRILASVGNDFFEFKNYLNIRNIDTDWVEEISNELTSTCMIFCDNESNHVDVFYPGPTSNDRNLTLVDKNVEGILLAIIAPTDVQSMLVRSNECISLNIPYIFDPGLFIESFRADELLFCCRNSTILVMNDREFSRLQKHTGLSFSEATELCSTVVVTRGKNGSTLYYCGNAINIPIVEAYNVLNTVGAGDAYKAGLALGMINSFPIVDCCKMGSTVSSFNIETHGSMNHTFTKETFIERYIKHFNDSDDLSSLALGKAIT